MRAARWTVAAVLLVAGLALASRAEKPSLTPERRAEVATHVLVGEVQRIYSRVELQGRMQLTRYVAELSVEAVEKGEGIAPGDLVYARYWEKVWKGDPDQAPADAYGHVGTSEGARVRAFLARNADDNYVAAENRDGGLNVLYADGLEALPK
jgi:hypothetical protein